MSDRKLPNENYFDLHIMLELSSEVIRLKTELGSMGTDMKGATDTTSELTIKNNDNKMLLFCTVWSWTSSLR
jgi:hypothetical protein